MRTAPAMPPRATAICGACYCSRTSSFLLLSLSPCRRGMERIAIPEGGVTAAPPGTCPHRERRSASRAPRRLFTEKCVQISCRPKAPQAPNSRDTRLAPWVHSPVGVVHRCAGIAVLRADRLSVDHPNEGPHLSPVGGEKRPGARRETKRSVEAGNRAWP